MTSRLMCLMLLGITWSGALWARGADAAEPEQTLVDFGSYPDGLIKLSDAQVAVVEHDGERMLQVNTGHAATWPGVTLPAPDQPWDLSALQQISLSVRNVGSQPVTVNCRVDSPGGDGSKSSITQQTTVPPDESRELTVTLTRQLPATLAEKLYGMRGYPGGYAKESGIDASQVTQLIIFVNKPDEDYAFQLSAIRALRAADTPSWLTLSTDQFFPMIDELGQFMHAEWPGKVHAASELSEDIQAESRELETHPGPDGWNQYGGWAAGPQLRATGHFYPVKHGGMWWLVDPEGRLFWSHGVDCVGFTQGTTPISDREFYFAALPAEDTPLARFYGQASWAPHGYYQDKGTYRTYNFAGANLLRKYGEAWQQLATETMHRRLRSWCMNTIGNWSDSSVYALRKTPYVVATGSGGAKSIEGSSGYWGKFPDPFDPSFRDSLERNLQRQRETTAGDPWCIGYFVDNELAWGDDLSLAIAALASPVEQAAKQVFLSDLKAKYATIEKLNEVWGTEHDSWQALAETRTPPDKQKAAEDLGAFYTRIAEEYFRNCRDAVKQMAPDNLYLGCRFAWVNDRGAQAAAKFCDVIGYNLYRDSVADFRLPDGIDMPVIIGEFHFGALDRGMFHTGLRPTDSQQDRAEAYRDYVTGALKNPCLVGTHWFQFGDQATTGRGDGENYQIGLVTICDRPYPETIAAVREIGETMYRIRSEGEQ